jgi:predicted O-methyltransferase YrrM
MNPKPITCNTLREERVQGVLARLHRSAAADTYRFIRLFPRFLAGFARGKGIVETLTPQAGRDIYMTISTRQGNFLYQTARAIGARRIVEFGTSFGVSTIYLAAAVRDNGGGLVIGTELDPGKQAQATRNLVEAGLSEFVEIRLGDALETLKDTPEPIDMVFMDGWKVLYQPVLQMLKARLRPGAVVLSDDIVMLKKALRPYVAYLQSGENGFESTTLPMDDGLEYSVYLGNAQ